MLIMEFYFSAPGHAGPLKFSCYVHLTSVHQIFQYRHVLVILCNIGEVCIFYRGLYISYLEHARMLMLSNLICSSGIHKHNPYILSWVI